MKRKEDQAYITPSRIEIMGVSANFEVKGGKNA
jgi:hypothetical protein